MYIYSTCMCLHAYAYIFDVSDFHVCWLCWQHLSFIHPAICGQAFLALTLVKRDSIPWCATHCVFQQLKLPAGETSLKLTPIRVVGRISKHTAPASVSNHVSHWQTDGLFHNTVLIIFRCHHLVQGALMDFAGIEHVQTARLYRVACRRLTGTGSGNFRGQKKDLYSVLWTKGSEMWSFTR